MLLSHIKRLCTFLPPVISAFPDHSDPPTIRASLPPLLQKSVPACAQPCLQDSLFKRFPLACTSDSNLACLCSHYSTGGESLGEVALRCIYASCPTDSSASSAYNVCLGYRDAVPATLTALTVTASPPSTSTSTSTITKSVATSTSSSTIGIKALDQPSITIFNTNSVASTDLPSSSIISQTTQASANASVTATTTDAERPKTMTPAQIAGLSIAAAATFVLAIGLMVLSTYLRRRREQNDDVTEIVPREKKQRRSSPKHYSKSFSQRFSSKPRSPTRTRMNYSGMEAGQARPWGGVGLTPVSRKNTQVGSGFNPIRNPSRPAYVVPASSNVNSRGVPDYSSTHPALRPPLGNGRNSSAASLPLSQIGLAVTAELPNNNIPIIRAPRPPERSETRPHRPKSVVRRPESSFQRPYSVLTNDTLFEEDVPSDHRRESKLLPTPPIPIPPIRALQPSRPQPTVTAPLQPNRTYVNGPQAAQTPELFLNIPVRHPRSQPKRMPAQEAEPHGPVGNPPAYQLEAISSYDPGRSTNASMDESELNNGGYIPDYYFTSHETPPPVYAKTTPSPTRVERLKASPKLVNIRPKISSSNVSRATSKGTASARDSISSQTSFETVDPNEPTPDDEDDDKQLSDNKLSPVAESPISNLRYPKVPRASNQLVPRSPKSPHSQRSDRSPISMVEASSLLAKRRGESEAHELERQLRIRNVRQHLRSSSSVESWGQGRQVERHTRSQSGMWPISPMMYDETDVVRPLNIPDKAPDMNALKSPAWVPRLTPTRQGDDLLISVSYAKPGH